MFKNKNPLNYTETVKDESGNVKKYKLDLPSLVKNRQPSVNPGAKIEVIDANRIDDTIVDTKTENNTALYKLLYETPEEQRQSINTDKIMVAANQDVNNAQNQIRNLKIAVTRTNPPDANTLQSLKEQEQKLKNAENKLKELSNIYKNNPNDFVNRVYEYNYNKATSPGLTGLKNITRSLNPMNMMSSRASSSASSASSASNSVTQKNNVRSIGKGKKITITFIQDDRNQCFIKDYNLCSVDNVSTELSNVYDDKLVIDGNNKPVKSNIQNIGKNQTVNYKCDSEAAIVKDVNNTDVNTEANTEANTDVNTDANTDANTGINTEPDDKTTAENVENKSRRFFPSLLRRTGGYNASKSITRRKSVKPITKRLLRYSRRSRNSRKF